MNKRLTAKRLLKRHNRHASSDQNWADISKPDKVVTESILPSGKGLPKRSA